jgi:Fe-S cluster assembly iron-binding protein IscA
MLEITEKARGVLQEFLEQHKEPRAVRILLQPG